MFEMTSLKISVLEIAAELPIISPATLTFDILKIVFENISQKWVKTRTRSFSLIRDTVQIMPDMRSTMAYAR